MVRTPARSIDAAIVKESAYGCDCRSPNGIYRHNSPAAPMASQTFFGHGPTRAFALGYGASRFTQINDEIRKQQSEVRHLAGLGKPAARRPSWAGSSTSKTFLDLWSQITNPELPLFLDHGKHAGRCYCGAVEIEVRGEPIEMGYCHCENCRRYSTAPWARSRCGKKRT